MVDIGTLSTFIRLSPVCFYRESTRFRGRDTHFVINITSFKCAAGTRSILLLELVIVAYFVILLQKPDEAATYFFLREVCKAYKVRYSII